MKGPIDTQRLIVHGHSPLAFPHWRRFAAGLCIAVLLTPPRLITTGGISHRHHQPKAPPGGVPCSKLCVFELFYAKVWLLLKRMQKSVDMQESPQS